VSNGTHDAQALARHVKAALLHLRRAEDIAEQAGIDIYGGNDTARLIRSAGEATEDLDLWAANNARSHGAPPAETYPHAGRWCHAPAGSLPEGSWSHEPQAPVSAADREALARGMLAPDAVETYAAILEAVEPGAAEVRAADLSDVGFELDPDLSDADAIRLKNSRSCEPQQREAGS
jgi:hypothetical protein